MNLSKTASLLISSIAVVVILIYGKNFLIPFVFALLLWIMVREIKKVMDRVPFIKKYLPSWIKSLITSLMILSLLGLISKILTTNISNLAKSYKAYQLNVESIVGMINENLNIDVSEIVQNQLTSFDFSVLFSSVFNSITELMGSAFMILIYALFVFMEENNFEKKLSLIFKEPDKYEKVSSILGRIEDSVTSYLGLKVLVSSITGILSYITLLLIGVDSPAFWAFLIFLLNFIPTIGSLIATVFPVIFALLQFGEFFPSLMVLVFVGAIQLIVGNVIEPKLMGNSLNISSLVAILALSFWAAIWGVTGMILSIPITVIAVIICSQFPKTKLIAIMLSEKGVIH